MTLDSLMVSSFQAKIEALGDLRRQIKVKVDEVKYSGVGGGHRRKLVDDHEEQLVNSAGRLERSRMKYERLDPSPPGPLPLPTPLPLGLSLS